MNYLRCTYCGSHQHTVSLCPYTWSGSVARTHLLCSYCGAKDHNYEACPKIRAQHARDPNGHHTD